MRTRNTNTARASSKRHYEKQKREQGTTYDVAKYRRGQCSPRVRSIRLWNSAKSRARKSGLEVSITTDWVEERIQRGVCEVSGLPFVLTADRSPFAPSLDRIDNTKGYTEDNTQVVVWMYNAAKHVFTANDVLTLAEALCTRENK